MTNTKLSAVKFTKQGSLAQYFGSHIRTAPILTKYMLALGCMGMFAFAVMAAQSHLVASNSVQLETTPNTSVSNLSVTSQSADPSSETTNSSNTVTQEAGNDASESINNSSNTSVTVNGQNIAVPENGSTTKTVPSGNGSTTVQIESHNGSTTTNNSSASVNLYTNTTTNSYTSSYSQSSGTGQW